MASHLPTSGQDNGTWGDILNDFLLQEHNPDGTLKIRSDGTLDPSPLVTVKRSSTSIGTRAAINFIPGSNVTLTTTDNPGSGQVDVTVAASTTPAALVFLPLDPYFATGIRNYNTLNPSDGYEGPSYAVRDGMVYIKGAIDTALMAGGNVFVGLPAGVRPLSIRTMPAWTASGFDRLDIMPNGTAAKLGGGIYASYAVLNFNYLI